MKKQATILYIEDENLVRNQAVEYLSLIYKNVLEAKDGLEGLEVYKKYKPDIIISDIEMPKMNGLEMAKEVRKLDKKVPIIIATAYTHSEYLLEALELQLIKYIVKPVTAPKLKEALEIAYIYVDEAEVESVLNFSDVVSYDRLNKTLLVENKIVKLSHNEIALTDLLVENKERVVTYEEIESTIWAYEGMSKDALRTLVRVLRAKMQENFIENVSGYGYRIKVI
ncbi:MAG TPA: DNA-binding response regulator [Sulfurospirillum arcachonense]|nr:DNA-binding response regulator [Sulfurospirillum arcachonense]